MPRPATDGDTETVGQHSGLVDLQDSTPRHSGERPVGGANKPTPRPCAIPPPPLSPTRPPNRRLCGAAVFSPHGSGADHVFTACWVPLGAFEEVFSGVCQIFFFRSCGERSTLFHPHFCAVHMLRIQRRIRRCKKSRRHFCGPPPPPLRSPPSPPHRTPFVPRLWSAVICRQDPHREHPPLPRLPLQFHREVT